MSLPSLLLVSLAALGQRGGRGGDVGPTPPPAVQAPNAAGGYRPIVIDPIVTALMTHGKVRRGFLGVGAQAVQLPQAQAATAGQEIGLLVVNLEAGGPADAAGILLGDILLTVAGSPVTSVEALQEKLTGELVGVETAVTALRGGAPVTITVTVGERA